MQDVTRKSRGPYYMHGNAMVTVIDRGEEELFLLLMSLFNAHALSLVTKEYPCPQNNSFYIPEILMKIHKILPPTI